MAVQEVAQRHGKLYRPAADHRLFHADTPEGGVAPGTAIGLDAAFSVHNPLGSGVDVAILKASMGYISGTLGAGTVWHLVTADPSETPAGTPITEIAGIVNGAGPRAIALSSATIAVALQIVRPFCSVGASLATSAVAPWQVAEDVEGGIILPPGCTYALHGTLDAGTDPLVAFGVSWEEITIGVD